MSVEFGGWGGSECVHTGTNAVSVTGAWTICLWRWGDHANGNSDYQDVIECDGAQINLYGEPSWGGALWCERSYSGTTGVWYVSVANQGITVGANWWFEAWVFTDDTSAPTVYLANADDTGPISRTVTTDTTPTGSPSTGASTVHIGNYNGHDSSVDNNLAFVGMYGEALAEGQVAEHMRRGMCSTADCRLLAPLWDKDEDTELSGSGLNLTVNSTPIDQAFGPPVTPSYQLVPRPWVAEYQTGVVQQAVVDVVASSTVTATAVMTARPTITVNGISGVDISAHSMARVQAAIAAASGVTAQASITARGVVAVAALSNVTARGGLLLPGVAAVGATSSVTASAGAYRGVAAQVDATSTVTTDAKCVIGVSPSVAAQSSLSAVATAVWNAPITVAGQSLVNTNARVFNNQPRFAELDWQTRWRPVWDPANTNRLVNK